MAVIFASGLIAGAIVAGLTVAKAQTSTPSPSVQEAPYKERHFGFGGFHHGGFGPGVLHGEFTTPAPGGGFQTLDLQTGDATSVASSSLTVKSEDGFSKTYAVDDNTLVNAGNEGIDDVKKGDTVRVVALAGGGTPHAVKIADVTTLEKLRGRWLPLPPRVQIAPTGAESSA